MQLEGSQEPSTAELNWEGNLETGEIIFGCRC